MSPFFRDTRNHSTSIGADFQFAVRSLCAEADDAATVGDQVLGFRFHQQVKGRITPALPGEEIEEIPLRHQRYEFAAHRQMTEVHHWDSLGANLKAQPRDLLVWNFQEFVEQPKLVHQFERRGMDGVAAEVTQEIGVLLQHDNVDAGAGEQKTQHHAGRPAAGDAAAGGEGLRHDA